MEFIVDRDLAFYREEETLPGVRRAAEWVRGDLEQVTGARPRQTGSLEGTGCLVVYGTAGHSPVLDRLAEEGLLSLPDLAGRWEVYCLRLIERAGQNLLVIAGSDKRGTIYGLLHLSELLGVSPLVNWAGVRPPRRERVVLSRAELETTSREPSVRYRGFFINDEWPAFGTWATEHFGGVNALLYARVFELLLRLKGNYLWPAMWSSRFYDEGPGLESAQLADELGVVMGTSHHEPCIRCGEEYRYLRGPDSVYGDAWDFWANREGITRFWRDGLRRGGQFENIITLGMRGERDTAILAGASKAENIRLLREVIATQNQLIREEICQDLDQVRRLLVLFTEVESFFYGDEQTPGLLEDPELNGVTLMLCDDNFGNVRTLPVGPLADHPGGWGLYYHLDFHGGPHSYEWVNSSNLPKMWEQLTSAYENGIREVWIVNVGDIGLVEYPLQYFMDLAYDMERYGVTAPNRTEEYTRRWLARQFPRWTEEDRAQMAQVLADYTALAHNCKPEAMNAETYHPRHFGEADAVLERAARITSLCDGLRARCPADDAAAFWELIYYPAMGTANLQAMWIAAGKNAQYAAWNAVIANSYAQAVRARIERDRALTAEYHAVDGGRWSGLGLSEHIGFTMWCEEDNRYPQMTFIEPSNKPRLLVALVGEDSYRIGRPWCERTLVSRRFLRPDRETAQVELLQGGRTPAAYTVETSCPWLSLSQTAGCPVERDVLTVRCDRAQLTGPARGTVTVRWGEAAVELIFEAAPLPEALCALPSGTFLAHEGILCWEAAHFARRHDTALGGWVVLSPYGRTGSGVKVLPPQHDFLQEEDRPWLEYDLWVPEGGIWNLELSIAPAFSVSHARTQYLDLSVNDGEPLRLDLARCNGEPYEFLAPEWRQAVVENIRRVSASLTLKGGLNCLRLSAVSPAVVLERLLLAADGVTVPASRLGPEESARI